MIECASWALWSIQIFSQFILVMVLMGGDYFFVFFLGFGVVVGFTFSVFVRHASNFLFLFLTFISLCDLLCPVSWITLFYFDKLFRIHPLLYPAVLKHFLTLLLFLRFTFVIIFLFPFTIALWLDDVSSPLATNLACLCAILILLVLFLYDGSFCIPLSLLIIYEKTRIKLLRHDSTFILWIRYWLI